jgi:hypothetical protein
VTDADYLLARAAAEADAAERAVSRRSSELHGELASGYLDRVFGGVGLGKDGKHAPAAIVLDRRKALVTAFQRWSPVQESSPFTDLLVRMN